MEFSASDLTHNVLIYFLQNTPVSAATVPIKHTKLISHDEQLMKNEKDPCRRQEQQWQNQWLKTLLNHFSKNPTKLSILPFQEELE